MTQSIQTCLRGGRGRKRQGQFRSQKRQRRAQTGKHVPRAIRRRDRHQSLDRINAGRQEFSQQHHVPAVNIPAAVGGGGDSRRRTAGTSSLV